MKTLTAFPSRSNVLEGGHTDPGMDLRDYFAAHAPKEIPDWFKPAMPEKPKRMAPLFERFRNNSFMRFYNDEMDTWEDDAGEVPQSFKDHVNGYIDAYADSVDQVRAWESEYERQRLFQWPWHYADGILKARVREQEVDHA